MTLQPLISSPVRLLLSGGLPGNDGVSTTVGTGSPPANLGNDGDSYIDSVTGNVWERAAGTWTDSGISIAQASITALQQAAALAIASAAGAAASAADAARSTLFLPSLDFSDPRNSFLI